MTEELVMEIGNQAMLVIIKLSLPILVGALLIGILVSIFQAVTQIHEMTLTFVPKILAVIVIAFFLGPWMLQTILDFTGDLFINIPLLVR